MGTMSDGRSAPNPDAFARAPAKLVGSDRSAHRAAALCLATQSPARNLLAWRCVPEYEPRDVVMSHRYPRQTVVIAGRVQGLGRALTERFASDDSQIYCADRNGTAAARASA
jgi:hypothetical protein